MEKHILVISQYFYPEQFRINDICEEWVQKGYQVTVLTGIPNYPFGKFYEGFGLFKRRKESYQGIDIIRIPIFPRGKNSLMLVLNYISFVISGFFWSLTTRIKTDTVFIFEVSPMTQALPGIWFSKKRKIPCFIYVQDLWPENVQVVTGLKNEKILGLIGKMVDYIYKNCSRIFTTSNSFITSINSRNVPLNKLTYWPQYAEEFFVPLKAFNVPEIPNDEKFNIIFAGNIGTAQGLEILLKVSEILTNKSETNIRFNLVGDGRYKDELIRLVNDNNFNDLFNFIPKQPAKRIPEFLAACDAAFLSLANNPVFEMTIPAKLQTYMACGVPTIVSASGEACNIINKSKSGMSSKPGDPNELANNIINISKKSKDELLELGQNARTFYIENFEKNMLLNKMDTYINS